MLCFLIVHEPLVKQSSGKTIKSFTPRQRALNPALSGDYYICRCFLVLRSSGLSCMDYEFALNQMLHSCSLSCAFGFVFTNVFLSFPFVIEMRICCILIENSVYCCSVLNFKNLQDNYTVFFINLFWQTWYFAPKVQNFPSTIIVTHLWCSAWPRIRAGHWSTNVLGALLDFISVLFPLSCLLLILKCFQLAVVLVWFSACLLLSWVILIILTNFCHLWTHFYACLCFTNTTDTTYIVRICI